MAHKLRVSDEDVLICEGARVAGNVTLGKGVSVWYNAVIRGDEGPIVVGENTNIQDGAVLHTGIDRLLSIGSGCTIGHNAVVHGCTIGDYVLVGMGSIVMDGARIGNDCIIGAGALVTGKMDAPAGSMLMGAPAKVVRPLRQEEIDMIHEDAEIYLRNAELYRKG